MTLVPLVVALLVAEANSGVVQVFTPTGTTPYLSPEESLRTIELPDGYRLELVLSEPDIKEPVQIAFDGNGRMYVAEMRTYMQDIDGTDELTANSRVSRHESSRRDGRYDKHLVFADNLLLPRQLLTLDDRVIIGETNTNDLFVYRDTNRDGKADRKDIFYKGGGRGGNLEHQPNGLLWSMDNWLYSTYNSYRLRYTPTGALREPTAPNGGQWGVAQDDHGKVWFSMGGGETGLLNFQTHIAYAAIELPAQFVDKSFREVFPLVGIPDVQGGDLRFRPGNKTLNHFTATCGHEVYRGDRLPTDARGDIFLPEPVGRLIRRARVEVIDGVTTLRNVYPGSEFLRSTDPNFRPVNMATGPDGALYIVDMYRGIIQEGNWVMPGSYLRDVVKAHGFEKNVGRGRIWRLVHRDFQPGPQPRMLDEKSAALVRHLEHPNGWWRDTAQKLLILRNDKSVVPALTAMVRNSSTELARLHALWTLEGLGALNRGLLTAALEDASAHVRENAVRASESWLKDHPNDPLIEKILARAHDRDPSVVVQVLASAVRARWPGNETLINDTLACSASAGVKAIAPLIIPRLDPAQRVGQAAAAVEMLERGRTIYRELCFACHGDDGRGAALAGAPAGTTMAPSLRGASLVGGHRDVVINVLLAGLTGPVDDQNYTAVMVPMRDNDNAWIAAIASYIRTTFDNHSSLVTEEDVARLRARHGDSRQPWTVAELQALAPAAVPDRKEWKATASHNLKAAQMAIDDDAYSKFSTEIPQAPGMWFQVELPRETVVSGFRMKAVPEGRDFPQHYEVVVSTDGRSWGKPVATGEGAPAIEVDFAPTNARFIRINQTGTASKRPWAIYELRFTLPGS